MVCPDLGLEPVVLPTRCGVFRVPADVYVGSKGAVVPCSTAPGTAGGGVVFPPADDCPKQRPAARAEASSGSEMRDEGRGERGEIWDLGFTISDC